jgi:hypothetical protein
MCLAESEDPSTPRCANTPEFIPAKFDAWLAMPDVDSEFEAFVEPRHNTIVRYALWQVLLKTYPAATIYTDWRDYSNDENIALESNLNNHRPGCTISAAEQIDPPHGVGPWRLGHQLRHDAADQLDHGDGSTCTERDCHLPG